MSETRTCGECRGAGYVPRLEGMDDRGYHPCPVCQGTARVWDPEPLRDAELEPVEFPAWRLGHE